MARPLRRTKWLRPRMSSLQARDRLARRDRDQRHHDDRHRTAGHDSARRSPRWAARSRSSAGSPARSSRSATAWSGPSSRRDFPVRAARTSILRDAFGAQRLGPRARISLQLAVSALRAVSAGQRIHRLRKLRRLSLSARWLDDRRARRRRGRHRRSRRSRCSIAGRRKYRRSARCSPCAATAHARCSSRWPASSHADFGQAFHVERPLRLDDRISGRFRQRAVHHALRLRRLRRRRTARRRGRAARNAPFRWRSCSRC